MQFIFRNLRQSFLLDNQKELSAADNLFLQLHEQYAINNNANLSGMITLVVALTVTIGYFGMVFINCDPNNAIRNCCSNSSSYNLIQLFYVFTASILVLAILFCLCVYQGTAQRKEQFIIDSIRKRYLGGDYIKIYKVFPKSYSPFYKKGIDFIQGIYGELVKIYIVIAVVLFICVMCKLINCDMYNCYEIKGRMLVCAIIIIVISIYCYRYYVKKQYDYIKLQVNYIIANIHDNDNDNETCILAEITIYIKENELKFKEKKRIVKRYNKSIKSIIL